MQVAIVGPGGARRRRRVGARLDRLQRRRRGDAGQRLPPHHLQPREHDGVGADADGERRDDDSRHQRHRAQRRARRGAGRRVIGAAVSDAHESRRRSAIHHRRGEDVKRHRQPPARWPRQSGRLPALSTSAQLLRLNSVVQATSRPAERRLNGPFSTVQAGMRYNGSSDMRLLLVEDEARLARTSGAALGDAGYARRRRGRRRARRFSRAAPNGYDAVVLDLGLPQSRRPDAAPPLARRPA